MQSKTSSFKLIDKTIFWKNVKRCWPIWGGYAFIMLWLVPGIMYFNNALSFMIEITEMKKRMTLMIFNDCIQTSFWVSIFTGILFAMAIFSYLQNERACNLIHSLPLTRETLYSTGILSGMIMMAVPNLVVFGIANMVSLRFGINSFVPLCQWLLMTTIMNLFFFALGIMAMIIVGNTVAAAFVYGITLEIVNIILAPVNSLAKILFYGLYGELITVPDNWIGIIRPIDFFSYFRYTSIYNAEGLATDYVLDSIGMYVIVTLAVSALIIAASILLYRIRKSEMAGEMVAIEFLRPVFRWIFAIIGSILMTWLIIDSIFDGNNFVKLRPTIAVVLIIIFGVLSHIIAEMIIRKNFRIMKGFGLKLAVFTATIIAATVLFVVVGKTAAAKTVEPQNCKTAWFEIGGQQINADIEDLETKERIYEIHKYIIDNYDDILTDIQSRQFDSSISIVLGVTGVDGKEDNTLIRQYMIPSTQYELYDMIQKFANDNLERIVFNHFNDPLFTLKGGRLFMPKEGYDSLEAYVNADDALKVVEAFREDIRAGYLTFETAFGWSKGSLFGGTRYETQKPVGAETYVYEPYDYNTYTFDFEFSYRFNDYLSNYSTYDTIYFNDNCVNTLEALKNVELLDFDKYMK